MERYFRNMRRAQGNKITDRGNEYRVLAIATVFFLAGLFFFWYDRIQHSVSTGSSASGSPAAGVSVQSAGGALEPSLANFPPPSQFQTFMLNANGINGNSGLTVTATCHDVEVVLLAFSEKFDYRSDISKAVYNRAFSCTPDKTFHGTIQAADVKAFASGMYYVIVADQGDSGTWYNPR